MYLKPNKIWILVQEAYYFNVINRKYKYKFDQ